ncbi:hypothetical protein CRG98_020404, partial [Punica granatum]
MFHGTLKGAYYSHLMGHMSTFSKIIMAGKQVDLDIKLGRLEGPTREGERSSRRRPLQRRPLPAEEEGKKSRFTGSTTCGLTTGRPPLYSRFASSPTVQNPSFESSSADTTGPAPASICTLGENESEQDDHSPFVIEYVPAEVTIGFTGLSASPTPFVIDVPAREPYLDNKVPWAYKGNASSLEHQFSVMGVMRSGRVYENPEGVNKGKAPTIAVGRVMIDNNSALNVCLVSTLKQMNVDLNRIHPSKTTVRAFDGSRREVNGEINLLIEVGLCSFSVTFQVLDIPNAFSLLLGRPWIHSAGAVPSTLHQRLKFIVEEKLITVKGEEDYAIYKETVVPYISIGDDENLPFHSFETISVIRDYGKVGPSRADRMIGKVLLRNNYVPGTGLKAQGQGISCPIEVEEGITVLPLSHFFLGPPHIVGDTLDYPSSDSDNASDALPAVCTIIEKIPSGVHIHLAQENEELDNWTSVPRYSAVIADVELLAQTAAPTTAVSRPPPPHQGGSRQADRRGILKSLQLLRMGGKHRVRGEGWKSQGRLNYIAHFIANLSDKCQPLFRLLRKNATIEWDDECQKAFDDIKTYLVQSPVLVPPTPGRPLILYLTVRRQSLGCMLGQEDESTRAEHAIYYLSKKFTEGESNHPEIEKMCCALGQAIVDHLAEFPIEDDTPINSHFPDERILQVDGEEDKPAWKMYFDGVVNSIGSGIGAVLISPDGRYYPIAAKVDYPCTNNVAEYEACILGLQAAIDFKVKELEVFGDSTLTIFQTLGQWKTKDAKLVPYHEYLEELAENFEKISFTYTPRIKNQFADAIVTLASMVSTTKENLIKPLEIEIAKGPAYYDTIEATDEQPWYEDIKHFLQTGQYSTFANRRDWKTLRRLAAHHFLSEEAFYRCSFDATLL